VQELRAAQAVLPGDQVDHLDPLGQGVSLQEPQVMQEAAEFSVQGQAVKLKDDKTCYRHDGPPVEGSCRFAYCVVMRCPYCELETGMEWGPIACPHKKNENGAPRWYKYPDMGAKAHVPVKRSILMRKRNQPRK
jgi:hypothetical protein